MPNWTHEQQQAIETDGKNIIVSAGAGSGKTAVLSARVLRKLKNKVNINELLVLTFTKAAAHEMKERIRDEIKKEKQLHNQLDMIDAAYITTFDSYALSVVKKYHYLLNVSSDVSICEDSIISLKKEEIIDKIFEELYELEDENFLKLINDFCTKDDNEIKNYIISISNKLDLKYDKTIYLKNYIENNFNDKKIDNDINLYLKIILDKINLIKEEIKRLDIYVSSDYYNKILEELELLLNSRTYQEVKSNLDVKLPILPRNCDEIVKKIKEGISKNIKELKELCVYIDNDDIKQTILSTKSYIQIICKIILELDNRINKFKEENDIFEFNDIAKMAIRILKENEEVRCELKYYFNEILVDEYQDTNDLQEEFISLISNNNVYMVGDIKQSIYRFRNANPYIFKNKYDNYSKNNGGIKIDLNKNFRSRREVLDNINKIFNIIMDDLIGGAEYRATHQMVFGNLTYENEGMTNQNNNFEIYNYEYDKALGYEKPEIEAFIIATDIKKKIDNNYQVFDKDEKINRNINYSDFVILMDRTTNFDLYKKIFEYLNIPLNVYKDDIINNGVDIYVIRNILKIINKVKNKIFDEEFKYCFMSIARSFLFDYNDNEIFKIIKNNSYKDTLIMEKINKIVYQINHINSANLINLIMDEFDFYNNLIKIGGIEDAMIRIEYLNNLAITLSNIGYDIDKFITYIDDISNKEYEIKYSSNKEEDNSVKIMTIHKSKGLEYHICYYSGLYAKFNISDLREKFTFDNEYGIISPYVKDGIYNTIYKTLLKDKYLKEEISEKIRLFYVAMTRAKEKMILVTQLKEDSEYNKNNGIIDNNTRLKYSSFNDILKSIKNDINEYFVNIDLKNINLSKDYNIIKSGNYINNIPKTNKIININEIHIDNKILSNEKFSKNTHDLIPLKSRENMKFGEYMHYILEVIDFKNPNLDNINIDKYYKDKIIKFLNSDIMKNINDFNIYKEYEFMYTQNNILYHGIIDLMLENDDEIIIIDYKLKNIDDSNYLKQLEGYSKYINSKTNKKVSTYLYSIIDEKVEEIKVGV